MIGQWLMRDSVLMFVDKFAVGVKEYSLDGTFLNEHIRQGRGPDEMICPPHVSAIDECSGDLTMQDQNGVIVRFDRNYEKAEDNDYTAWFNELDTTFLSLDWKLLYDHPDPEIPQMYEYNFECRRMRAKGGMTFLPVITEHAHYNGYSRADKARKFWREAYTFISFDPDDIAGTKHLFGHYPPVYRSRNLPVFATYDFYLQDSTVVVGFAADLNLYVMDFDGNILKSFGFEEDGVGNEWPQTKNFEQYESSRLRLLKEYGRYGRISHCGRYIFRNCKLPGDRGWRLQIYEDDGYDLIGIIDTDDELDVLGSYDGTIYASCGVDLDAEQFKIVKFRID